MEVLLCQDVKSLGKSGEVINVKTGYARNYLIPKQLACPVTTANLRRLERKKAKELELYAQQKGAAEALAEKLNKVSCTVTVEVNDLDRLYGSVTETDIINALELEGIEIDKNRIMLDKPINELGIFEVGINLHSEVTAKVRVWVAKK